MMDPKHGAQHPYTVLGAQLRSYRQRRNETLAEASGAVEIDVEFLERIEEGRDRPSEDILMLLINHFEMQDQEAVKLWESAGYDSDDAPTRRINEQLEKAAIVLLGIDARILYSDGLSVDANKSGLVLNFTQASPQHHQIPVARVGMSYEQAEQAIKTLQTAILYGRRQTPRRLPPGSSK